MTLKCLPCLATPLSSPPPRHPPLPIPPTDPSCATNLAVASTVMHSWVAAFT